MSKLVEELKEDHLSLVNAISSIKTNNILSDSARKTLFECKGTLLNHLKKEDENLYPVLRKAALTDAALKDLLENFAKDMELTSKSTLSFFEKYEKDPLNKDFGSDIASLISKLSERIRKEEFLLYPLYDKIMK